MIILHGDSTVQSRNELAKILSEARAQSTEIVRVDAKSLNHATLESTLGEQDLFGTPKLVVIETLHSLPRSKKKDELIKLVSKKSPHQILLWEKRTLTKTMLKSFPDAQVREFKMSNFLFNWLDMLGGRQPYNQKLETLHQAIKKDGDYLCFIMVVRHVRLLLLAKTGGIIKGPPFMVSKYKKQAQMFSETQLLQLHTHLVSIDEKTKTSTTSLNLESQLDLLTLGVYI
ncbi:MAG: hypothetical protein H6773_00265 [Pseudomonadales bacterium]|nr:hypothetical protein [Pseudomonadales bacterium]